MIDTVRFEKKIYINHPDKSFLEMYIKSNPLRFIEIFHIRRVNNIYFDTVDMSCFEDNIEGSPDREKMRIRWYGSRENIVDPTLEIKIKKGNIGLKNSYKVNDFKGLIKSDKEIERFVLQNVPSNIREEFSKCRPVLVNSFLRKYYLSLDKRVRLTIDWDLSYRKPESKVFIKYPVNIVEVKFKPDVYEEIFRNFDKLPTRISKFSKYAVGIKLLYQ